MKSISKKIYLLIVLAVMSFCAVLFPMSANTAKADVTFDLAVTHAQVKVQKIADSEAEEWAIMFKSTISAEQLAAAEGTEVKFGMLIGPTTRVGDNATHADYVADGFQSFAHVNSADIKLEEGATGFDYWAGIKYNDEHLNTAENRLAAAKLSLTAIPFYQVGEEIVLGTSGACQPRNILTESYVYELENEIEDNIPVTAVNNYAGEFTQYPGEAYVCKATDRLMTAYNVGGDLTPEELTFSEGDELYANGVKYESIDAFLSADLEVNGASSMIAYTEGYVAYIYAKHAERVITRYFHDEAGSSLEDYLAGEKDTTNKPTKSGDHASIFYMATATANTFDGLYVLANDLIPTKSGSMYNSDGYAGYSASAGYGFVGTFDGRGKTVDFVANGFTASVTYGGFFSSLYGATVKNVAFEEINTQVASGAAYGCITQGAANTLFENVYVNITRVNNFHSQYNAGLLFGTLPNAKNEFKNMIVNADLFDYNYYDNTLANETKFPGYATLGGTSDKGYCAQLKSLWSCGGYCNMGGNKSYDNFFSVGTNLATMTSNRGSYTSTPAIDGMMFISMTEMPYYNDNGTMKQCAVYDYSTGSPTYAFYSLDQFVGTMEVNGGTDENENDIPDFIEEKYRLIQYVLECRFGRLEVQAQLDAGKVVKLAFNAAAGLYDFTNDEFASFVKDANNAEQLAKFDSAYWVVDAENGTITWKGLSA